MATARGDHGGGAGAEALDVLAHQAAPIGEGRLDAEAEEAERAEQQDDEDEAQAEIGQDRGDHVRQDLARHDGEAALAAGAGDFDEVGGVDVDGDGADDAEGSRGCR